MPRMTIARGSTRGYWMTRWLQAGRLVVSGLNVAAFVRSIAFFAFEPDLSSVVVGPMYSADSSEV